MEDFHAHVFCFLYFTIKKNKNKDILFLVELILAPSCERSFDPFVLQRWWFLLLRNLFFLRIICEITGLNRSFDLQIYTQTCTQR